MKSRRNFIVKTGITTAGLLAFKPFKSLASSSIAQTFGLGKSNRIVLLHTSPKGIDAGYANEKIASLKHDNHNLLLLEHHDTQPPESQFEILYRGNLKVGLIRVTENKGTEDINRTATALKQQHNCDLVVCLSSLGYKKKQGTDDLSLAEKSSHIDFVIGCHPTNHTPFPVVARNQTRGEVIIHHAADNGFGLGNIEVEFDSATHAKRSIGINNLLTRLPEKA